MLLFYRCFRLRLICSIISFVCRLDKCEDDFYLWIDYRFVRIGTVLVSICIFCWCTKTVYGDREGVFFFLMFGRWSIRSQVFREHTTHIWLMIWMCRTYSICLLFIRIVCRKTINQSNRIIFFWRQYTGKIKNENSKNWSSNRVDKFTLSRGHQEAIISHALPTKCSVHPL